MSRLKTALMIGVAVFAASAGSAQAANSHSLFSLFGLIDGYHEHLFDFDRRIDAIDLTGDDSGDKVSKKPDGSNGPWQVSPEVENKMTATPADKPETTWTTQTVTQPQSPWSAYPASP